MKKAYVIAILIFFCTGLSWADAVDQQLPETATQQVRTSARQMVAQGFNNENVINLTRQMLEHNFSQQQILQAHTILMNAQKQGLQTEPIMNKAQEGCAKQVQPEAIVRAMEQVQARSAFAVQQAKTITNDRAKANQMATILADSMAAGMTRGDSGRIMQALQARARNMTKNHAEDLALQTFMTTRMMARLGMQSKSVTDSVCQALQQGYTAQEMHNMQNTIMANSRHSFSESFSRGHSSNAGQHSGQEGMGGHGGASGGGGMGGGSGPGGGGMGGGSGPGGGGMGGGNM